MTIYVEHDGESINLAELARRESVKYETLISRWRRGEREISKLCKSSPAHRPPKSKYDLFGRLMTAKEISESFLIDIYTVRQRIKSGDVGAKLIRPKSNKCLAHCVACQQSFILGKKPQKYCSRKCAHTALVTRETKECLMCGSEFKARNGNQTEKDQIYCSRECAYSDWYNWAFTKDRPPFTQLPEYTMVKPCELCSKLHPHMRRLWCSDECQEIVRKQRYNKSKPKAKPRKCKECDLLFTPLTSSGAQFCTKLCCTRHGRRIQKAKRRARKRGNKYEPVNPFKVFDRDGWRCQLCGTLTPRKHRGTIKPNAPELDHRVPLSKGGDHNYGNTQCLCRACNCAKGNSNEAGQLGLFVA